MIEMLGELIAGILGLIKKGDLKMAADKLDNLYYSMLKEDAVFFEICLKKGSQTSCFISIITQMVILRSWQSFLMRRQSFAWPGKIVLVP